MLERANVHQRKNEWQKRSLLNSRRKSEPSSMMTISKTIVCKMPTSISKCKRKKASTFLSGSKSKKVSNWGPTMSAKTSRASRPCLIQPMVIRSNSELLNQEDQLWPPKKEASWKTLMASQCKALALMLIQALSKQFLWTKRYSSVHRVCPPSTKKAKQALRNFRFLRPIGSRHWCLKTK